MSYRFQLSRSSRFTPKVFACYLAFFWSFFLATGIWLGEYSAHFLIFSPIKPSLFCILLFRSVVLFSTLVFTHVGWNWALFLLVGLRGLCYGFVLGFIFALFGNAGWLYWLLFCSTSSIFSVLDLWLWSIINANEENAFVFSLVVFLVGIISTVFNLYFISSFTIGII